MTQPADEPASRNAGQGWLVRIKAAHFHDYSRASLALWLVIAACGLAALAGALVSLGNARHSDLLHAAVALGLVCIAAWFPIEVPRSKYSISASDAFVFTILGALGPAPAILACGCDGLIGSWRSTKRLTSRIITPAAAMAAMAVCALVFGGAKAALVRIGVSGGAAHMAGLVIASLIPFLLTTWPLLAIVTLKRGTWPDPRNWLAQVGWVGSMLVAAALLAGLVQLAAMPEGPAALAVIGVASLAAVLLVRFTLRHNEAERRAQETRAVAAEQASAINQERFASAFANAAIAMAIVGADGRIVRGNAALCALLRTSAADLEGKKLPALLRPVDLAAFPRQVPTPGAGTSASPSPVELRCRPCGDDEVWISVHCSRFRESGAGADGLIYQMHDVTPRRRAECRLQHMAFHDDLTGLLNRAGFHASLARAVEDARRDPAANFALLFLDVDRFKVVNDSLGHVAGNELLRGLSVRLKSSARAGDEVARLGGDEFALLLHGRQPHAVLTEAATLLADLRRPIAVRGNEVMPSVSIGITFSDLGYQSTDELVRDADLAMYEAKAAGRGRVVRFDRAMHERTSDRLALEQDLRHAIAEGQLALAFQPLYNLEPYRLVGFEALARWTHPTRGPISPALFIPLAEETGQIEALTLWALDAALARLAAWQSMARDLPRLGVSVNLSGKDLAREEFAADVLAALTRHGVQPRQLTLEITESILMSHLERAQETLTRLRKAGVGFAIDDFGTGYSSLAYLSRLPIDILKVDRSFVAAMDAGDQGVEVVRAIQMLGRSLSKKVVAEGIETEQQLDALRQLGVAIGQGYFLGRPLSEGQVVKLLEALGEPA